MNYMEMRGLYNRLQLELKWIEFALQTTDSDKIQKIRKDRLRLTKTKIELVKIAMRFHENRIQKALDVIETADILSKSGIPHTLKNDKIYI